MKYLHFNAEDQNLNNFEIREIPESMIGKADQAYHL